MSGIHSKNVLWWLWTQSFETHLALKFRSNYIFDGQIILTHFNPILMAHKNSFVFTKITEVINSLTL